jgi:GNAT superfamily N-acetyltransferase
MSDGRALVLRPTPYDSDVVRSLEAQVQAHYREIYGGEDESGTDTDEFAGPDGVFLVGWVGDEPVATGGLRRHDERSAEIKRMYVVPEHRGHGHARELLAGLEDFAERVGYAEVVLETGARQPDAIALYESSGYRRIENFGYYQDSPLCRSFAKTLPPRPAP